MGRFALLLLGIIQALLVLPRIAFASGEGTGSASFLKIDHCARAAAMGGAACGVADDIGAAGYNAAALGMIRNYDLLLSHNEWLSGIKSDYAAYAQPLGRRFAAGGSLNYLQAGGLAERDILGNETGGTVNVSGAAVSLGAGFRITKRWAVGGMVKAVNETLGNKSDTAYAGDAGILYVLPRIRFGLSVQNAGTGIKVNDERFSLPTAFRAGIGWRATRIVLLSLDGIKGLESTIDIRAGGEVRISRLLSLCAGYRSGPDNNTGPGISAGIGLSFGTFKLDYAFLPYGDLGDTHRICFRLAFPYRYTTRNNSAAVNTAPATQARRPESLSTVKKKAPPQAATPAGSPDRTPGKK